MAFSFLYFVNRYLLLITNPSLLFVRDKHIFVQISISNNMSVKVITIVGMGPGISFSVAKAFAQEGFTIAMIARRENALKKLKEELNALGYHNVHPYFADVTNEFELKNAFRKIHSQLGNTDILLYNVSVFREATPLNLDIEAVVKDFRANVVGAIISVHEVIDGMKRNNKGKIFITGGGLAIDPYPEYASLGIGKAAIRNLAQSLYKDLKPMGIHAATVTVCGMVQANTKFAPDIVAEHFVRLYKQNEQDWEQEVLIQ